MTTFSIDVARNSTGCEFVLCGEIDLAVSDAFIDVAVRSARESGAAVVVFDLGAVSFIDSTGLGALVAIRKLVNQMGKDVAVRNVPARIQRILAITGLDLVFPNCVDGLPEPSAAEAG